VKRLLRPLPSKTELDASICAARLRKSETIDNSRHCLVQSARHFRQAFGFLRVFFYAAREFLKIEARIVALLGHGRLDWLLRRENNVSCPQSDAKNQGLSNAKKVDVSGGLKQHSQSCESNPLKLLLLGLLFWEGLSQ